ncbi:SO_0444 family Cu/Zn efflux transporter [Desulforapulum autotrophicum]|nr:SO_0444 family Cu/Zn efflux transporter [Desulforapulum autotrophicum]
MIEAIIVKTAVSSWGILVESSGFILLGFVMAGLLKAFVPGDLVARHLGNGDAASVLKAAAFGVPVPLCSCGVLPAAAGLRKQGASKGATSAFLIATPETGVDSIAVTWALLDPVMTVLRPLAAFFTATTTGILVNRLDREGLPSELKPMSFDKKFEESVEHSLNSKEDSSQKGMAPFLMDSPSCGKGCGCTTIETTKPLGVWQRLANGIRFAFGDLFADIGPWFLGGIILAGLITALLSPEIIQRYLGDGIFSMVAMLVVAVPLYVCATASTPIVAALALKGLSPGAALVFLLAGPATNAASLTVVTRILGKKATGIYLGAIIVCSLGIGMMANTIYDWIGIDITSWVQHNSLEEHGLVAKALAILLLVLILKTFVSRPHGNDSPDNGLGYG